jgi:uncharacterized membrane protein YfcA
VQIYLPIADIPVSMFLLLAMGIAVGFVSGMFGIGGGFLLTPLLIFVGITPAVAVASVTTHIAASSFSGALSYVVLLGSVGSLMLWEGVRSALRSRQGAPVPLRRGSSHSWVHGLPLKMRFKRSRIYLSVIPVIGVGMLIGFVGAIMGVGGGFLLVPILIYWLRVPTSTVIGTSMMLTLITMIIATLLHAATNHLVDAVLALVLMVGGVVGAQFGARAGQSLRSENLRLLLGLLILAVGIRFAVELVLPPADIYTVRIVEGGQ